MTQTISACLIVRDEERSLPGCLDSIRDIVDEIVVVDTGSEDDTVEVAKKYDTKVYHYEWEGHFGEARNYSFDQATSDWILYIDADERLSPELQDNLPNLIDVEGDILYKLPIEDELLSCAGPESGMIRLWKRGCFRFKEGKADGEGAATQKKSYSGDVRFAPYPIIHCQRDDHWLADPTRILPRIQIDAENTVKTRSSVYYYIMAPVNFCKQFTKWFVLKRGYKDGIAGLKFAFMKGMYYLLVTLFVALRPDHKDVWKNLQRDDIRKKLPENDQGEGTN